MVIGEGMWACPGYQSIDAEKCTRPCDVALEGRGAHGRLCILDLGYPHASDTPPRRHSASRFRGARVRAAHGGGSPRHVQDGRGGSRGASHRDVGSDRPYPNGSTALSRLPPLTLDPTFSPFSFWFRGAARSQPVACPCPPSLPSHPPLPSPAAADGRGVFRWLGRAGGRPASSPSRLRGGSAAFGCASCAAKRGRSAICRLAAQTTDRTTSRNA